ncbi:MerR family transcriptional regulator [Aeoliella mucimassa]|uniref:Helix-turn-helix domain protein n=1 Tax=Aeoliella mucimassa TaxID=2527972 RepID=A0A518ATZ7_9BACT|nr:DNA-binding protein [Aeoliella mucimassa]QDU58193.1 hypothetical protein Pan181_44260 [Aeoliella mucimassa]
MTVPVSRRLLLSREEAAKQLGIGIRTLDAHIKLGNIAHVPMGRLIKLHPQELQRVADEGLPILCPSR